MNEECFNCGQNGTEFHAFIICDSCKKNLRLFTGKTIEKYILKFTKPTYQKDIKNRLILLEKDFTKKKIKLMDILAKLEK